MVTQLLEPAVDVLVRDVFGDVVDEQGADGAAIVGGGDGAVPLLAGGVPDLGLDRLGIDLDGAGGELDANGGFGLEVELVAGEARQEVGLADAREVVCRVTARDSGKTIVDGSFGELLPTCEKLC
ncbi:hypothetical protein SeMB42_g02323 [Synchytrium endobioticum]|uniref:Uncharacterized protein n=1 Tax=Synchytrium endobioticum TaxID=286115 RepID=A0A507DHB7_9FUNG|nr:hypothetical protein SeMB42_g02323 [Synchytrium endobioticum]